MSIRSVSITLRLTLTHPLTRKPSKLAHERTRQPQLARAVAVSDDFFQDIQGYPSAGRMAIPRLRLRFARAPLGMTRCQQGPPATPQMMLMNSTRMRVLPSEAVREPLAVFPLNDTGEDDETANGAAPSS